MTSALTLYKVYDKYQIMEIRLNLFIFNGKFVRYIYANIVCINK